MKFLGKFEFTTVRHLYAARGKIQLPPVLRVAWNVMGWAFVEPLNRLEETGTVSAIGLQHFHRAKDRPLAVLGTETTNAFACPYHRECVAGPRADTRSK